MSAFQVADSITDPMHLVWQECSDWWIELIGQAANVATFDKEIAKNSLPYSDVDAAEWVAERLRHRISYIDAFDTWYVWDGRVHRPLENDSFMIMLVKRFAREYRDALTFVQEVYETEVSALLAAGNNATSQPVKDLRADYKQGRFREHRTYRTGLHSARANRSLLAQMRSEFNVPTNYFDDDRRWLVIDNGVIDLDETRREKRVMKIYDHSPERRVTRYLKAKYDPNAKSPVWNFYLETSIPDPEVRRFLQKVTACAFMAEPKLKVIPNLSGPANSGKSVFLDIFCALSRGGSGYASEPPATALMHVNGQNFEQDKLRGKRFVGVSEPNPNDKLDEGFVKKVSGGDWTETRTLHKTGTGWIPQCVMFIASNDPVRFNTRDDALLNRVALIDFPKHFVRREEAKDGDDVAIEGLEGMLLEESSGILLWLINGMYMYLHEGLTQPDAVKQNRTEMRVVSSTALRWVQDMKDDGYIEEVPRERQHEFAASHWLTFTDAWESYQKWAFSSNERFTLSKHNFGKDLDQAFGKRKRSDSALRVPGLVMTPAWEQLRTGGGVGNFNF